MAGPGDYDHVVDRDETLVDAFTGRTVFVFRRRAVLAEAVALARSSWQDVATFARPSVTRRAAAGPVDLEAFKAIRPDVVGLVPLTSTTAHLKLADGRVLRQPMSNPVLSFLAGYGVDRFTKTARANLLTNNHPVRWTRSVPFFHAVDAVHAAELPAVHAVHLERIEARHPAWRIPQTALSTVTINVNYESRYHHDTGDFRDGYSALTVVERGAYDGGLFVLPGYRVAVDVREGDVLLCQSHVDLHGNTRMVKRTEDAQRLSFVVYLKHSLADAVNRLQRP